jgi:hypothetical protein
VSRIRLQASLLTLTLNPAGTRASISGTGDDLASGRRVAFHLTLVRDPVWSLRIAVGRRYARHGKLDGGYVSVTGS